MIVISRFTTVNVDLRLPGNTEAQETELLLIAIQVLIFLLSLFTSDPTA